MRLQSQVSGWRILLMLKDIIIFSHTKIRKQKKESWQIQGCEVQEVLPSSPYVKPWCIGSPFHYHQNFILVISTRKIHPSVTCIHAPTYLCNWLMRYAVSLPNFKLRYDKFPIEGLGLHMIYICKFYQYHCGPAGSPSCNTLTSVGTCHYDSSLGDQSHG